MTKTPSKIQIFIKQTTSSLSISAVVGGTARRRCCIGGRWQETRRSPGPSIQTLCGQPKVLRPPTIYRAGIRRRRHYQSHSRYKEAEALYRKALEGNEKLYGPEHPDVLHTVDNLAIICRLQRRYNEAEELFYRVMTGRKSLLGPEHPDTLGTMNNLGTVYLRQDRYKMAEELYKGALAGNEKLLGSDHPDTLGTVHNLALAYDSQRQHSEAEKLYRQALEGREKVLGLEHPDTLWTVRALADFFKKQGRHNDRIILKTRFPLAFKSR